MSMKYHSPDPRFESKVRESFLRQAIMDTIGAKLAKVEAGAVEIILPFRDDLTQQHGFLHAGIVGTCLDSACGYSAFSLMPAGKAVLTVEYKMNLLAPAKGTELWARGRVTRAGKNLMVCHADGYMVHDGGEKLVATMLATIMAVEGRDNLRD